MQPALTHHEYRAAKRLPALDGIRAVAVLAVITWHVRDGAFAALNGDFGVDIFFVLSGFLITTLALREEEKYGKFGYGAFMVRRAFRILPLLWLGIAIYAVAVFGFHLDDRASAYAHAIPYYLAYLPEVPLFSHPATGVGDGPVPFSGVWSLGIEEKFYLVWPVIAFVVLTRVRQLRVWVAGLGALAIWVFDVAGPQTPARYIYHYAPILVGCFMALLCHSAKSYPFVARLTQWTVSLPVLVAVILLNANRPSPMEMAIHQLLVGIIVCAVVVRPESLGARAMSARWLAHIGVLSYALYLFHSLAFKVTDKLLPAGTGVAIALCSLAAGLLVAVPACEVIHRLYELPFQEWGRRLAARINGHREPALRAMLTPQEDMQRT